MRTSRLVGIMGFVAAGGASGATAAARTPGTGEVGLGGVRLTVGTTY